MKRIDIGTGLLLLALPAAFAIAQNIEPRGEAAQVAAVLRPEIEHEIEEKKLPSMAIAVVDGDGTVWAEGFGYEDAARTRPATAHTVFRIGSVSKLFTDLAVMQLVEQGKLDLDAPVTRYLPSFHPHNPFGGEITLRELMSHRAGLVREPPVGHYFDDSSPSIDATVASLNETTLAYAPGTHTKYSNAGVAVVGDVLQQVTGQPFAAYLRQAVLRPLAMEESAFSPQPALMRHLSQARMWSYDGLDFQAPQFELGESPAGAMYATVTDLGKFLLALCDGGNGPGGAVVKPATLDAMWKPQFEGGRFGLGFVVGSLDSHREVGHDGAIYGFATSLAALPEERLGVVVVTTADSANAVTDHIAQDALRLLLASHNHAPLKLPGFDQPVGREFALAADGDYEDVAQPGRRIRLEEREGKLALTRNEGGMLEELMIVPGAARGTLHPNSRLLESSETIEIREESPADAAPNGSGRVTMGGKTFRRVSLPMPAQPNDEWSALIGEYGWDYDKLYVLEDRGRLNILVEWFEFDPLKEISPDHFHLPGRGLYDNEDLTFLRDAQNHVTGLRLGYVVFPRRHTNAPGEIFQITPLKTVDELRREALAAKPPVEKGDFRVPDLVELTALDPTIKLDIRYASTRNFLGSPLYLQSRAFMQRPAAEAVARASKDLHTLGYGLLIHDSYRPWYVTDMFWEGTPDDKKIFVADPRQGSRHNRGCAVDLTLYDLKTGEPIQMTGGYDEMSERSYPFYPGGSSYERWHRDLLRHAMEAQGFTVYEFEWWHFDYKDWKQYPILNLTFEELDRRARH